jgi:uncharacterized protein (DUF2141 family)
MRPGRHRAPWRLATGRLPGPPRFGRHRLGAGDGASPGLPAAEARPVSRAPGRSRRRRAGAAILAGLLLALAARVDAAEMKGEIRVKVVGLRSDAGALRFGLYNRKETFATKDGPIVKGSHPIRNHVCEFVIGDLPYGVYAIIVGHDVNGDGKINENPFSEELKGISNYSGKILWFPDFDRAKFRLDQPQVTVEIRVY